MYNSSKTTIFPTLKKSLILYFLAFKSLQIGLAVGDIEAVQRNARLKRLAMQVLFFKIVYLPLEMSNLELIQTLH